MKRAPEEYDWILLQFNNAGIEPVIIAGQAVNIWGKYFREWDEKNNPLPLKIRDLLPLTSDDLEVLETKVVQPMKQFEGLAGPPDIASPFGKATSNDAATFHFTSPAGLFKVQVMKQVLGADNDEIFKRLIPIKIGKIEVSIKVPDPITLLKCKIENLAILDQEKPKLRFDLKHVKILICCIRALIGLTIASKKEREALNLIKRMKGVTETASGKKVKALHGLNWNDCIPFDLIRQQTPENEKWQNFLLTNAPNHDSPGSQSRSKQITGR